ncbi:MAG: hypothetical protein F6J95_004885 [Leptolyngbya sp. SIO1E4]|nr:hypothetical protein [Leptolyngbya sp. SIO1E4]
MQLKLTTFPGLEPLIHRYEKVGQQPDNLCGPYWVSLLLQVYDGLSVSAVDVALSAATVLPSQGDPADWLPSKATPRFGHNYDRIPTTPNLDACGTSVTGLIHATETLSQGRFCLVPLQTTHWVDGLDAIRNLCQTHPDWQAVPILNVHTSYLWNFHLAPLTVLTYLQTGELSPPLADWKVGHFALLIGQLRNESDGAGSVPLQDDAPGSDGKGHALYAVLDTYPHFGWNGLHFQPPAALAQSLQRPNQPTQGGIALFVTTKVRPHLIAVAEKVGFQIAAWDNGSPMLM